MSKIHVLDYNIINKIAAGEVVERPSSVVKELLENSIDSGAMNITVEIKDGGTSMIRVTDNGSGIIEKDIKSAFLRHATSKIANIDDLQTLITLGFRGEALSSIASVSQIELITKTPDDIVGTRIEIHGGEIISEQKIGCADGTTIIVNNLFYNIPVRRKFLKSTSTETGYVSDIINKLSLGHPEISFKYINNGSIVMQTNGNNNLKTAILNVYGKDIAKNIIEVQGKNEDYILTGFIGKPEIARATRKYQNFFINKRFVKSTIINSSVEEAYKTRLMNSIFPMFILNLQVPPENIDVNVHPNKLEVRFSDEKKIYDFVVNTLEYTLNNTNLITNAKLDDSKNKSASRNKFKYINKNKPHVGKEETSFIESTTNTPSVQAVENNYLEHILDFAKQEEEKLVSNMKKDMPSEIIFYEEFEENNIKDYLTNIDKNIFFPEEDKKTDPFFVKYKILGQIFGTYWIVEQDNSMYLIDQHSAHERVLYEDFLIKFRNSQITSQLLISPESIRLDYDEYKAIEENWELLESFGFKMEKIDENVISITSVPYVFDKPSNYKFFFDIVDKLVNLETSSIENIYDMKLDSIAMISCKAAVKGNHKLKSLEAKALIEKMLKLENPFSCPHGRPTIIEISKHEIEKKFKRKV